MSSANPKSSAEIEREVERSRADIQSTLEELRSRMSPGQLVDQALDYLKSSGGSEFAGNLGHSVRDNPLPVAMIGIGIGWLMLGGGQPAGQRTDTHRHEAGLRPLPAGPSTGSYGVHSTGTGTTPRSGAGTSGTGMVGDAASRIGESVSSAYDEASDRATRAVHDLRDSVGDGMAAVSERVGDAADSLRHGAERLGSGAQRVGGYAQSRVSQLLDEQPMVLGAIGLAIGAAIGAMLPATRVENQLMGSSSDRLKETVVATAKEEYAEAATAVADAGREIGDKLDEKAGSLKEAIVDTAEKVRDKVAEAADKGRQRLEDDPSKRAQDAGGAPDRRAEGTTPARQPSYAGADTSGAQGMPASAARPMGSDEFGRPRNG